MNIVAIEASARTAGAAVMKNGQILAEEASMSGLTHSQTLMPMVARVMKAAGLSGADVDAIAFTNGPGSFTGLRIGAATAKGLALGWGCRVLPVSTLEALAFNAVLWDGLIVPVMDARRQQVYTAVYRAEAGNLIPVLEPAAMPAAELVAFLQERGEKVLLLGDTQAVPQTEGFVIAPAHLREIRAAAACAIALQKMEQGTEPIPSDQVTVEYLRRPQAERERLEREKHAESDPIA